MLPFYQTHFSPTGGCELMADDAKAPDNPGIKGKSGVETAARVKTIIG
jgi:hypothetical protein